MTTGNNNNSNSVSSAQANNNLSNASQPAALNRSTNLANTPRSALSNGGHLPSPMNSMSMPGAQKAAMAAQQNWRQGLNNNPVPPMNQADPAMLKDLAMMNTLAAGFNGGVNGMNINNMANLAAMAK
jgi:hypothetical protein